MPVLTSVTARDGEDGDELVVSEWEGRHDPSDESGHVVRIEVTGVPYLTADELRELADQLNDLHRKITRSVGLSSIRPVGAL